MRGMGRAFKRGEIWWVAVCHHGKERRYSTGSTDENAVAKLLKKKFTEIERTGRLADRREDRLLWRDLAAGVIEHKVVKRSKSKAHETHLKRLGSFFDGFRAIDIKPNPVRKYVADRIKDGAAIATVNAELSVLKLALNIAHRDERLSAVPYIAKLEGEHVRQGFVKPGDFERLVEYLPAHLKDPIRFLYLSSWRTHEIRTLEWKHIDLERKGGALIGGTITLAEENSKTGEGRVLRLKGEFLDVIARAAANRRLDCLHVFHDHGRPLGRFRDAWHTAVTAAGLGKFDDDKKWHGLNPHDLRRSGIRNAIRSGVDRDVAMAVSGHKTGTVFSRYNISSTDDLDLAAEQISDYNKKHRDDTNVATIGPMRSA